MGQPCELYLQQLPRRPRQLREDALRGRREVEPGARRLDREQRDPARLVVNIITRTFYYESFTMSGTGYNDNAACTP